MIKKLLLLLFLPLFGFSQASFGENATWHFDYSAFGYNGYKKVSHVGDTTMHNMTWLKFAVSGKRQIRTGPGPNDIQQDTAVTWPNIYLATRNDSVFRLLNGAPYLLYDLNAQVGDSWQFAPRDTSFGCPDEPIATVTAIGQDTIDGVILDYMDLSMPQDSIMINGQNTYQISSSSYLHYRVYPKLGSLAYTSLFEASPNLCNGSVFKVAQLSTHSVRCFSDNQISINRQGSACDFWSNISLEEKTVPQLKVYPNPSNGKLFLETEEQIVAISLMDISGKILGQYGSANELDLQEESGLYILSIEFTNGQSLQERIVIQ